MRPEYRDLSVRCWETPKLRNPLGGVCVSLSAGPEEASILHRAVREVTDSASTEQRVLTFRKTTEADFGSFRVRKVPRSDEITRFRLFLDSGVPVLEFTDAGAESVVEAFSLWTHGTEDFALSHDRSRGLGEKERSSGALWFWVRMNP